MRVIKPPRGAPALAVCAGPDQDRCNKFPDLQNPSIGAQTDAPVLETPLNVQFISQNAPESQPPSSLATALQNFTGVSLAAGFSSDTTG